MTTPTAAAAAALQCHEMRHVVRLIHRSDRHRAVSWWCLPANPLIQHSGASCNTLSDLGVVRRLRRLWTRRVWPRRRNHRLLHSLIAISTFRTMHIRIRHRGKEYIYLRCVHTAHRHNMPQHAARSKRLCDIAYHARWQIFTRRKKRLVQITSLIKIIFAVNIRPLLAYILNKTVCAPVAIESHVLLSSAIFSTRLLAFTTRKTTWCRAAQCVAFRCERSFSYAIERLLLMICRIGDIAIWNCWTWYR